MKKKIMEKGQISGAEISQIPFNVMIHTVDVLTRDDIDKNLDKKKPYVKSSSEKNGVHKICINPNRSKFSNGNIRSMAELNKVFKLILSDMNIERYRLFRVDIAIDTYVDFERIYKLNMYVAQLLATRVPYKDFCTNMHRTIKSSIYIQTEFGTVAIYNRRLLKKDGEIGTRFEGRFLKDIKKNDTFETYIKKFIKTLVQLPKYIADASEVAVKSLQAQYVLEKNPTYEGNSPTFDQFINKHIYLIVNEKIATGLYRLNNTGRYADWRYNFVNKKHNCLTLYRESDITTYIKMLKKSLKNYMVPVVKNTTLEANSNRVNGNTI